MNFFLIYVIGIVLVVQFVIIVYLLRRGKAKHVPNRILNYEVIRKRLLEQVSDIGFKNSSIHVFSARFALEGIREGNAKKIQSSRLREIQDLVLSRIREHGAKLKIQTAARILSSYCGGIINSLEEKIDSCARQLNELSARRVLLDSDIRILLESANDQAERLRSFFLERIPNVLSFADHYRRAESDKSMNREFGDIVLRLSEFRALAKECISEVHPYLHQIWIHHSGDLNEDIKEPEIQTTIFEEIETRLRDVADGSIDLLSDDEIISEEFIRLGSRSADLFLSVINNHIEILSTEVNGVIETKQADFFLEESRLKSGLSEFEKLLRRINANS